MFILFNNFNRNNYNDYDNYNNIFKNSFNVYFFKFTFNIRFTITL